jgi:excinuclease ABC subunit B
VGWRSQAEFDAEVARLELEMRDAAANLEFERAASLRDRLRSVKRRGMGLAGTVAGE